MKHSQKLMFYSLVGILTIGIFVAVANASAEEATTDLTEQTCDGTGTGSQQQKRQGNGTGDAPRDGTGNGNRHQYNAALDANGECINVSEA